MIYTFGFGHECRCGRPLSNCYTVLPDRGTMVEHWGVQWAFEYPDAEAERFAELKRIDTNVDNRLRCVCDRGPAPDYRLEPLVCTFCDVSMGALVLKQADIITNRLVDARLICATCKAQDLTR